VHSVIGADVARASTTLAEAFVDDPVKCFLVGRDEVPVALFRFAFAGATRSSTRLSHWPQSGQRPSHFGVW